MERMKKTRLPLAAALSLPIATLMASPTHAGGIGAGTIIENTAEASYETSSGPGSVTSNTTTLAVDELLDVTVTSLDGAPIGTRPGSATLTFEITNTGNGPESFRLTADPLGAGNDFDTTIDSIAVDTNGNGVYDAGVDEILTGPETTAELAVDEAITVFVNVTVPDGVADTEQSDIALTAEATTGTGTPGDVFAGQGSSGVDAIVGSTGATATATGTLIAGITTVDLVKAQVVADPFGGTSAVPGATITYTITANVSGSGSVSNLIVTDSFPAGTTYAAGTLTLDATSLTDASGDDAGAADATGISVDLGTVAGGTSRAITFDVTID